MTRIHERMYARCPFGKAPSFLELYLDELSRRGGADGSVLRLQVPLAELGLGIPGGAELSRDVIAHFAPVNDDGFESQQTAVDWASDGGGPFPKFAGFIVIESDEDYGTCSLVLDGAYAPPFGPVGAAFDAVLGRRIATVTARHLLRALRQKLEDAFVASQQT
jgi:hypothetical protein